MKEHIVCILFVSLFLFSCTNKQNKEVLIEEEEVASLPVLDIAGSLSASVLDTFTWNSVAKSVRLIPLSSKKMLGGHLNIHYIDDNVNLLSDAQFGFLANCDSTGRLRAYFRHKGNGPGEYVYLTYVKYNKQDSSVTVFDNNKGKFLQYSWDGKCLNEKIIEDRQWTNIVYIDNSNIIYTKNTGRSLVSVLNQNCDIVKEYFSFDTTMTKKDQVGLCLMTNRTNTRDKYLINYPLGDTLYSVMQSEIVPLVILQKENHVLTLKEIKEGVMKLPNDNDFITYTNLDVFSSFVLYRYLWHGKFSLQLWDFEKEKMVGKAELNQPDQFSGLVGGFNYVFDSGKKLRLIPNYVTDSYLGFLIPAEDCVGEIEGVKEDDNPVLVVMNLK